MPRTRRAGKFQLVKRLLREQYAEALALFSDKECLSFFESIQFPNLEDEELVLPLDETIPESVIVGSKRKRNSSENKFDTDLEIIYDNKPRIKSVEILIPPIKFRLIDIVTID